MGKFDYKYFLSCVVAVVLFFNVTALASSSGGEGSAPPQDPPSPLSSQHVQPPDIPDDERAQAASTSGTLPSATAPDPYYCEDLVAELFPYSPAARSEEEILALHENTFKVVEKYLGVEFFRPDTGPVAEGYEQSHSYNDLIPTELTHLERLLYGKKGTNGKKDQPAILDLLIGLTNPANSDFNITQLHGVCRRLLLNIYNLVSARPNGYLTIYEYVQQVKSYMNVQSLPDAEMLGELGNYLNWPEDLMPKEPTEEEKRRLKDIYGCLKLSHPEATHSTITEHLVDIYDVANGGDLANASCRLGEQEILNYLAACFSSPQLTRLRNLLDLKSAYRTQYLEHWLHDLTPSAALIPNLDEIIEIGQSLLFADVRPDARTYSRLCKIKKRFVKHLEVLKIAKISKWYAVYSSALCQMRNAQTDEERIQQASKIFAAFSGLAFQEMHAVPMTVFQKGAENLDSSYSLIPWVAFRNIANFEDYYQRQERSGDLAQREQAAIRKAAYIKALKDDELVSEIEAVLSHLRTVTARALSVAVNGRAPEHTGENRVPDYPHLNAFARYAGDIVNLERVSPLLTGERLQRIQEEQNRPLVIAAVYRLASIAGEMGKNLSDRVKAIISSRVPNLLSRIKKLRNVIAHTSTVGSVIEYTEQKDAEAKQMLDDLSLFDFETAFERLNQMSDIEARQAERANKGDRELKDFFRKFGEEIKGDLVSYEKELGQLKQILEAYNNLTSDKKYNLQRLNEILAILGGFNKDKSALIKKIPKESPLKGNLLRRLTENEPARAELQQLFERNGDLASAYESYQKAARFVYSEEFSDQSDAFADGLIELDAEEVYSLLQQPQKKLAGVLKTLCEKICRKGPSQEHDPSTSLAQPQKAQRPTLTWEELLLSHLDKLINGAGFQALLKKSEPYLANYKRQNVDAFVSDDVLCFSAELFLIKLNELLDELFGLIEPYEYVMANSEVQLFREMRNLTLLRNRVAHISHILEIEAPNERDWRFMLYHTLRRILIDQERNGESAGRKSLVSIFRDFGTNLDALVRKSSVERPPEPIRLEGTYGTTEFKFAEEVEIDRDGDCGFRTLGLSREEAVIGLLSISSSPYDEQANEVRRRVGEDIIQAMLERPLPYLWDFINDAGDSVYDAVRNYHEAVTAFDDLVRQLNNHYEPLVPGFERMNAEDMLRYLNKKGKNKNSHTRVEHRRRLNEVIQVRQTAEDALRTFSLRDDVYREFIVREFLHGRGWLTYVRGEQTGGTMDALAQLHGLEIYVWAANANGTLDVIHHTRPVRGRIARTVHLYHRDGMTHFNRLRTAGEQTASASVQQSYVWANVTTSLGELEDRDSDADKVRSEIVNKIYQELLVSPDMYKRLDIEGSESIVEHVKSYYEATGTLDRLTTVKNGSRLRKPATERKEKAKDAIRRFAERRDVYRGFVLREFISTMKSDPEEITQTFLDELDARAQKHELEIYLLVPRENGKLESIYHARPTGRVLWSLDLVYRDGQLRVQNHYCEEIKLVYSLHSPIQANVREKFFLEPPQRGFSLTYNGHSSSVSYPPRYLDDVRLPSISSIVNTPGVHSFPRSDAITVFFPWSAIPKARHNETSMSGTSVFASQAPNIRPVSGASSSQIHLFSYGDRDSLDVHLDQISTSEGQRLRYSDPGLRTHRMFREHVVDGSEGNCGFTAIGTEELIDLSNKKIGDEGLRVLLPLIQANKRLQHLILDGNDLTDSSIQDLANALGDRTELLTIHLSGNDCGIESLRALLPILKANRSLEIFVNVDMQPDRQRELAYAIAKLDVELTERQKQVSEIREQQEKLQAQSSLEQVDDGPQKQMQSIAEELVQRMQSFEENGARVRTNLVDELIRIEPLLNEIRQPKSTGRFSHRKSDWTYEYIVQNNLEKLKETLLSLRNIHQIEPSSIQRLDALLETLEGISLDDLEDIIEHTNARESSEIAQGVLMLLRQVAERRIENLKTQLPEWLYRDQTLLSDDAFRQSAIYFIRTHQNPPEAEILAEEFLQLHKLGTRITELLGDGVDGQLSTILSRYGPAIGELLVIHGPHYLFPVALHLSDIRQATRNSTPSLVEIRDNWRENGLVLIQDAIPQEFLEAAADEQEQATLRYLADIARGQVLVPEQEARQPLFHRSFAYYLGALRSAVDAFQVESLLPAFKPNFLLRLLGQRLLKAFLEKEQTPPKPVASDAVMPSHGPELRNARDLSSEYGLNTEEAVVKGFHDLSSRIKEQLGEDAWLALQAEALLALRQRDSKYFDPLVRDASDELRAMFGVYVARKLASAERLTQDELDLTTLIYILSHALVGEYSEDGFGAGESNDSQRLLEFLNSGEVSGKLSHMRVAELIKALERAIAYGSVVFARRLAEELRGETGQALSALFLNQCIFDDPDRRRPVVSLLGRAHLWLEFARSLRIPVVIRTRLSASSTRSPSSGTVIVVYEYDGRNFLPCDPVTLTDDTPVLVADAVTTRFGSGDGESPANEDVEHYIAGLDLRRVWLSGAAAHSQFAGANREVELVATPPSEPIIREMLELVEAAQHLGTSSANRQTQFVVHTYVAILREARRYTGRTESQDREPVQLSNGLYYPRLRENPITQPVLMKSNVSAPSQHVDLPSPRATPSARWGTRHGSR